MFECRGVTSVTKAKVRRVIASIFALLRIVRVLCFIDYELDKSGQSVIERYLVLPNYTTLTCQCFDLFPYSSLLRFLITGDR